jgi:hypothetical protein
MREALRLWVLTYRFCALFPSGKAARGEPSQFHALVEQDQSSLLDAQHKDRDRIEALLSDALEILPSYWIEDGTNANPTDLRSEHTVLVRIRLGNGL